MGSSLHREALPEWQGLDPVEVLGDILPSRAFALDEVRAEVMAEHWVGVAQDVNDFIYIHVGRRPSLALMLDGRTRPGFHGAAGDFSEMKVPVTKDQASWFETTPEEMDAYIAILRSVADGDEELVQRAAQIMEERGAIAVMAASIVDPEMVVLGGILASIDAPFAEKLQQVMDEKLRFPPKVAVSTLDEFGAAMGVGLVSLRVINDTLADPNDGISPLTLEEFSKHPVPGV